MIQIETGCLKQGADAPCIEKAIKKTSHVYTQEMVLHWCAVMDIHEQARCQQECIRALCRQHA